MMSVLYDIGNVKQRIYERIHNFFKRNIEVFIFIVVHEDKLMISLVEKAANKRWRIVKSSVENKREDDEFFFQEVLYKFCNELSGSAFEYIVVAYNENLLLKKEYIFPKMPKVDLEKALYWAIKEDMLLDTYDYIYKERLIEEFEQIDVVFMDKKIVALWQDIAKQQGLNILSMPFIYMDNNIEVLIEDEFLYKFSFEQVVNDELFIELQFCNGFCEDKINAYQYAKQVMSYVNGFYMEFLKEKQRPCMIKWCNVYIMLGIIIFSIIGFFISFKYVDYYNLEKQDLILQQDVSLIKSELEIINRVEQQDLESMNKHKIIKNLEENNVNIYGLLVNLSASTIEGIAIDKINVDNNKVIIKAIACTYEDITKYQELLHNNIVFKDIDFSESVFNEQTQLIDFTMTLSR